MSWQLHKICWAVFHSSWDYWHFCSFSDFHLCQWPTHYHWAIILFLFSEVKLARGIYQWLEAGEVKLGSIPSCLSRSLLAFSGGWERVCPHRPLVADFLSVSGLYAQGFLFCKMKDILPSVHVFSNSQVKCKSLDIHSMTQNHSLGKYKNKFKKSKQVLRFLKKSLGVCQSTNNTYQVQKYARYCCQCLMYIHEQNRQRSLPSWSIHTF